ncbi:MAG: glycosyltransferase family 2 protein [Opitutaceae bacterium]
MSDLVQILSPARRAAADSDGPVRLRSCVDSPRPGAHPRGPCVWIKGWCFDEGGRPPTGVRARIGGDAVAGVYGWDRGDVRRIHGSPPASERCGFAVAVKLLPGVNRVRLEAEIPGFGWVEFQRLELDCSWPRFTRHAFRTAAHRARRWIGSPRAFRDLTWEEREFLHAEMEQACHPLRLSPHHAPRPLVRESFPAGSLPPERLPKFVVVTPSYRQGRFLEETMRSVLDQAQVRIDYLVEDGGSDDGTAALLERYGPRLAHWTSQPDRGQADALGRGFARVACGPDDVMAYLNSDDRFMPGALRFVAEHFARHPEIDVIFGHRVLIDEDGREVGRWYTPRRAAGADLPWFDLVPQESVFWRRRIWERVGGIDPAFQFALDWDLLLRFAAAGARWARLPWFLGIFRVHALQKSQVRIQEVGIPEMDLLRRRTLGQAPPADEIVWRMLRAQAESIRLRAWFAEGWRR